MSTPQPDDDFTLNDEHLRIVKEMQETLFALFALYGSDLVGAGLTPEQSVTTIVNHLVRGAADSAVKVRRSLGGEPSLERWRAVTEEAFHRAVERNPAAAAD